VTDLHDRANALAGELLALKREAALAGDNPLNQRLKEVKRILQVHGGPPFSGSAYTRLQERVADELYGKVAAEDLVIQERKERLHGIVRAQVEGELEANYAELEAVAAELHDREANVAAREKKASLSYRAAFAGAGAGLALAADVLIRVVA
jgi:hypothetical protein